MNVDFSALTAFLTFPALRWRSLVSCKRWLSLISRSQSISACGAADSDSLAHQILQRLQNVILLVTGTEQSMHMIYDIIVMKSHIFLWLNIFFTHSGACYHNLICNEAQDINTEIICNSKKWKKLHYRGFLLSGRFNVFPLLSEILIF